MTEARSTTSGPRWAARFRRRCPVGPLDKYLVERRKQVPGACRHLQSQGRSGDSSDVCSSRLEGRIPGSCSLRAAGQDSRHGGARGAEGSI
jgi:hypothetical protein